MLALLGEQARSEPHAEELRRRGQLYPHPYLREFPMAPHHEIPREVSAQIGTIEDHDARMSALRRHLEAHPPQLVPFGEETLVLIEGLSKRPRKDFAIGAGVDYAIYKRLRELASLPKEWGTCPVCKGEGVDPAVREAYEAWERIEPPKGEGWQLWQTVSDGPLSPVFKTADELVDWMCEPVPPKKRTRFAPEAFPDSPWGQGWRREIADPFVKKRGWAPTMVSGGGVAMDGPEAGRERGRPLHRLRDAGAGPRPGPALPQPDTRCPHEGGLRPWRLRGREGRHRRRRDLPRSSARTRRCRRAGESGAVLAQGARGSALGGGGPCLTSTALTSFATVRMMPR
jgi:hypothetical protein